MSSSLFAVNDETFQKEVLEASHDNPVLVDFWAAWCGPCRQLTPVLERLSDDYSNIRFVAVDVDSSPNISIALNIRSIPTVILFDKGEAVSAFAGARSAGSVVSELSLDTYK